ncbi:hypothetical protein [Rhodovarius sp.]|uniref:hypothetical protein n=1 Tax=Rhodovarius sp. TaxID=2972673 RepID=UPI0034A4909B
MSEAPAWLSALFPDWLQNVLRALAPVVALGLSTWAIWSPMRARNREAKQRSKAIAVSIYPDVLLIKEALSKAEFVLSQAPFSGVPNENASAKGHATVAKNLREAAIPVPTMVDRLAEDMWRLGDEEGVSAAQMVSLLYQWNLVVEKAATRIEEDGIADVSGLVTPLSGNLEALKAATEATDQAIAGLHP